MWQEIMAVVLLSRKYLNFFRKQLRGIIKNQKRMEEIIMKTIADLEVTIAANQAAVTEVSNAVVDVGTKVGELKLKISDLEAQILNGTNVESQVSEIEASTGALNTIKAALTALVQ